MDGRDTIRDRGFSRVPNYVEEDGYVDTTGGLRGMLKLTKKNNKGGENGKSTSKPDEISERHVDPEQPTVSATSNQASTSGINYTKGLPQLYAECEVDYEYRFNGRIVDTNKEQLALDMLIEQLKKEEKEAESRKALEMEMDKLSAATVAKENGEGTVLTASDKKDRTFDAESISKLMAEGTTAYPTPTKIPSISAYYPLDLVLGAGQVTQAMDEALLGMYEGEETEWWLDPAFAFRNHGLRTKFGSIPADAAIQMKVKLLRFVNPMSSHERILFGTKLKDEANVILQKAMKAASDEASVETTAPGTTAQPPASSSPQDKNGSLSDSLFHQAILAYNTALTKLGKTFIYKKAIPLQKGQLTQDSASTANDIPEKTHEEQKVLDANLRAIIFTNLAMCWFKRADFVRSAEYADRALKCNPHYTKALFRKALIEERRCNFEEAILLLEKIVSLVENKTATDAATVNVAEIKDKIQAVKAVSARQSEAQRRTYQGMFGKGGL